MKILHVAHILIHLFCNNVNNFRHHISFGIGIKYLPFFFYRFASVSLPSLIWYRVNFVVGIFSRPSFFSTEMIWEKEKKTSNGLWWLSPIDWRRRKLLVYFIYLARWTFFSLFSSFLSFSTFRLSRQRQNDFWLQHVILGTHYTLTETIYIYTFYFVVVAL